MDEGPEPHLVVMVMDRMTDEVRQEFSWTMMFADNSESWQHIDVC